MLRTFYPIALSTSLLFGCSGNPPPPPTSLPDQEPSSESPPSVLLRGCIYETGKPGIPLKDAALQVPLSPSSTLAGRWFRTDDRGCIVLPFSNQADYTFNTKASGYKDGTCSGIITEETLSTAQNSLIITMDCTPLAVLPKLVTFQGRIQDGESGAAIAGAKIIFRIVAVLQVEFRIIEKEEEVTADKTGKFEFKSPLPLQENKVMEIWVKVEAPDYMPYERGYSVDHGVNSDDPRRKAFSSLTVEQARDMPIALHQIPKTKKVRRNGDKLELPQRVLFEEGLHRIAKDSHALMAEIAQFLRSHPEVDVDVRAKTYNLAPGKIHAGGQAERCNQTVIRWLVDQGGISKKRIVDPWGVFYLEGEPNLPGASRYEDFDAQEDIDADDIFIEFFIIDKVRKSATQPARREVIKKEKQ